MIDHFAPCFRFDGHWRQRKIEFRVNHASTNLESPAECEFLRIAYG